MNWILKFFVFLVLNFGALALGTYLMGDAVTGQWYQNLNKAPWTPPGWVFGASWTTIMLAFSIFMTLSTKKISQILDFKNPLTILFWVQWVLNVSWNYLFFNQQMVLLGLVDIALLSVVVWSILLRSFKNEKPKAILVFPYACWIIIAFSLNAYVLLYN